MNRRCDSSKGCLIITFLGSFDYRILFSGPHYMKTWRHSDLIKHLPWIDEQTIAKVSTREVAGERSEPGSSGVLGPLELTPFNLTSLFPVALVSVANPKKVQIRNGKGREGTMEEASLRTFKKWQKRDLELDDNKKHADKWVPTVAFLLLNYDSEAPRWRYWIIHLNHSNKLKSQSLPVNITHCSPVT